jgi:tetratricopeptide (TPR) repeat protein
MSAHDRIRRQQCALQAEGYLELGMASHALSALDRAGPPETLTSHALYLKGEALRSLSRFREAIEPLTSATQSDPRNIHIWLALGWCYKRTGRIDLAIESLEEALLAEPDNALVSYNLACYWSLAKGKRQALAYLERAFELDDDYRTLVADEPDFDPLRSDPDFRAMVRVTV